jgi:hypothetical protein
MGNSKREGDAGLVLPALDGIDGLPGHLKALGQARATARPMRWKHSDKGQMCR